MGKFVNLEGEKFGYLTVIKRAENSKDGHVQWLCRCRCGEERVILANSLTRGHTKSCGCYTREMSKTRTTKIYPGDKYGRLTVLERCGSKDNNAIFKCRCDCGKEIVAVGKNLRNGNKKSCGCLNSDMAKLRVKQSRRANGATQMGKATRLYRIYTGMRTRCYNKNYHGYENYGGRGITVCDEWDTFRPFYDWAMSHGYSDKLSIDRIDVNGNYCPENCRWATQEQQSNNMTTNVFLEYNGERMTVTQWARKLGIKPYVIYNRLRSGWNDEMILTTPIRKQKRSTTKQNFAK